MSKLVEKLDKIDSFETEWNQSRKTVKRKLKYHFWFYQNLSGLILVILLLIYWFFQMPEFSVIMFRIKFFFHWILQWFLQNLIH